MSKLTDTQHCECGSETYHIKRQLTPEIKVWAECTDCGRPTGVFGDGFEKQIEWYRHD